MCLTCWHFTGMDRFSIYFEFLLVFSWQDGADWSLQHGLTDVFHSRPQTAARRTRLMGSSPDAKGKSSFHWLILNVTFCCIMVDLRENKSIQQTVEKHMIMSWSWTHFVLGPWCGTTQSKGAFTLLVQCGRSAPRTNATMFIAAL